MSADWGTPKAGSTSFRRPGCRGCMWRKDAVVYSKKYGFLKMNTERKAEQGKYRILIGRLLFGEANVFIEDRHCVTLEPLKGECADIFNCGDMKGIRDVELCEVRFMELASPGRIVAWKQDGRDGVVLSRAAYVQYEGGQRVAYENHVLPPSTGHVMSAKFRYTLRDSRGQRVEPRAATPVDHRARG